MASTLRSLRPLRNEIKKLLADKPAEAIAFDSSADRVNHLMTVELYRDTLKSRRDTFFQLHRTLLDFQPNTEADQKALDEIVDSDSALLLELEGIIARYGVLVNRLQHDRDLTQDRAQRQHQQQAALAQAPATPSVKLPTIELKKFSGEVMQWHEFWDSFESAVHNNNQISPIDKFNYLRGQLTGDAKTTITGISLTNENYTQAVDVLKKRYGNNQVVINSHYVALSNLQSASDQTSKIRLLLDSVDKHLRSLQTLGEDTNHGHFISMILSKLPHEFVTRLEENRGDEPWTVTQLRQRARKLLEAREMADQHYKPAPAPKPPTTGPPNTSQKKSQGPTTTGSLLTHHSSKSQWKGNRKGDAGHGKVAPKKPCLFCEGSHWSDECTVYPTAEARKKKSIGKCFVCLRPGHTGQSCDSEKPCCYCKKTKSHHRSLCYKKFPSQTPRRENVCTVSDNQASFQAEPSQGAESALVNLDGRGLLQTATSVVMHANSGPGIPIRLVLDCGSQRTYVTDDLVKRLKAATRAKETLSVYTFGSTQATHIESKVVKLSLTLLDGSKFEFSANTVPQIGEIHHKSVDVANMSHLYRNLPLANQADKDTPPRTIDLLLGNNYYWDIVTAERIELKKGLYLIGSKLGWIVSGRIDDASFWSNKPSAVMLTPVANSPLDQSSHVEADQPLQNEVKLEDWWTLETIGIKDSPHVSEDAIAMKHFEETVKDDNQRYMVTWPWKDNMDTLPTNYALALGRLKSLIHRFQNDPSLLEKYNAIIQSQLDLGIIEDVTDSDDMVSKKHYIPHHPVITPDKATTKVRIVYDGSAKSRKDQPSINECLFRGPIILEDLCSLLIRFRLHQCALIADIEKAFLQVGLQPGARDVTRFLWLKNPQLPTIENNVRIFRFTRVPFGIICSPFLLGATIKHHLQKDGREISLCLLKDIYVDNLITGSHSTSEAISMYRLAKEVFQGASMNLREWMSNSSEVTNAIPEGDRMTGTKTKILGLTWDTVSDTLHLSNQIKLQNGFQPTKRTILQAIAKFYDPLGLLGPALVPAKLFLQRLWVNQKQWDDPLTSEEFDSWIRTFPSSADISSVSIPRYIGQSVEVLPDHQYELHCFTDASMHAYGAAVYLRIHSGEGTAVHLVFSKSRLAPTRKISLPRLELLAASIGGTMIQFVEKSMNLPISGKFLWSDSQCVLHWIKSSKPLSVFVENRVRKLRQIPNIQFHYVHTDQNPADLVSRGCSIIDLRGNSLWWYGPTWLSENKSQWPVLNQFHIDQETLDNISSEEKHCTLFETSMLTPGASDNKPLGIDPTSFSNWTRLLRVTALCLRFIRKLKAQVNTPANSRRSLPPQRVPALDSTEIEEAQLMWIKHIQAQHFADVFDAIAKKKTVPIQAHLGLWLDDQGLLRCKGRFFNAKLESDAEYPILLPKKDWFTTLLIRDYHERLFHSGTSHVLSQIRHKFWIPSGRSVVFQHIKSCLTCKRMEGGPYKPPAMPALPSSRVQASTPFTFTGLDYLGPLHVKTHPGVSKVWVSLFTCMATRAIHLELVEDLTANQFLMCLRRFIARRGTPSRIVSDNAAQFKLAQSAVDLLWKKATSDDMVMSYISNLGIQWTFIPERAPWFGGFYERLIQLVKRALKKSLHGLTLTSTQLQTVLTEVEAMLNSRPLVHVGADFKDSPTLTPSHFLTSHPKIGVPHHDVGDALDPDYVDHISSAEALLRSWKRGQHHLSVFWKAWKDEYLLSLRERYQSQLKGHRNSVERAPQVGDIVHVHQDSPRGTWPLAMVIQLTPSADGQIRSAKVRTSSGKVLTRAIVHLFPLEVRAQIESVQQRPLLDTPSSVTSKPEISRPTRRAATVARERIQQIALDHSHSDDNTFLSHNSTVTRTGSANHSFPSIPMAAWSLMFLLFLCLFPIGHALQPLICQAHDAKIVLDLSIHTQCPTDTLAQSSDIHPAIVQVFKRNIAKFESTAFLCRKITTTKSAWTGFAKAGYDHATKDTDVPVTETECRDMIRTRRCPEGALLGSDSIAFTENDVAFPYTSGNAWDCCEWRHKSVTNCFLTQGKVYETFGGVMESNLGNTASCDYSKGSCELPDKSRLIWDIVSDAQCEFTEWKKFQGHFWNDRFLSEDREVALTWTKGESPEVELCNGKKGILTDQGVPILYSQKPSKEKRSVDSKSEKSVDPTDVVAIRLQAMEERLHEFFAHTLNADFSQVCSSLHKMQHIDLILAHSQPTLVARYILNDTKVMAKLNGRLLEVWPCAPVDTYTIKAMHPPHCTEGIPVNVTVKGESIEGYIDPTTSIFYQNSAPSDCKLMEQVHLPEEAGGVLIYHALQGTIEPYHGKITPHPLYQDNLTGFGSFNRLIHKELSIYSLRELRAQISFNDLFASVDKTNRVLEKLADISSSHPTNEVASRIAENLDRYTPWGFLNNWTNYLKHIWVYGICSIETIRLIGALILWCISKRLRAKIKTINPPSLPFHFKQRPSLSSTKPEPTPMADCHLMQKQPSHVISLADVIRTTTEESF